MKYCSGIKRNINNALLKKVKKARSSTQSKRSWIQEDIYATIP